MSRRLGLGCGLPIVRISAILVHWDGINPSIPPRCYHTASHYLRHRPLSVPAWCRRALGTPRNLMMLPSEKAFSWGGSRADSRALPGIGTNSRPPSPEATAPIPAPSRASVLIRVRLVASAPIPAPSRASVLIRVRLPASHADSRALPGIGTNSRSASDTCLPPNPSIRG